MNDYFDNTDVALAIEDSEMMYYYQVELPQIQLEEKIDEANKIMASPEFQNEYNQYLDKVYHV